MRRRLRGVCAGEKISVTSVVSHTGETVRQIFTVRTRGEISIEGVKAFSSQESSLPQSFGGDGTDENSSRVVPQENENETLIQVAQTLKNIVCAGFEIKN